MPRTNTPRQTIEGKVEAGSERSIRVDGKWFELARVARCPLPAIGVRVRFTAYGEDPNADGRLFYRWEPADGSAPPQESRLRGSLIRPNGRMSDRPAAPRNPREVALMAAATASSSQGWAASAVIDMARKFEVYLLGDQQPTTTPAPAPEPEGEPIEFRGRRSRALS